MKLKESAGYGLQTNTVFVPVILVGLKLKFAEEVAFYAKKHLTKSSPIMRGKDHMLFH